MKYGDDPRQLDILRGCSRQRGRPASGEALTAAQRQALRRQRLAIEGRAAVTFELSTEVIEALDKFVQFKDETKGSVVDRILRGTLLRKR